MSTFIIKDYVVSRKRIGKGAFSTIYKAYNTLDNKQYAVKEVIIDKKSVKSNVKREFLVLKKLNHPNIVKLYDLIVDTSYNNIYFVFDYFPKGDFAKFLDNKPLKEKYCKKYAKQLADGLRYLIDNNIIHRDLKPQNILVTNELDIKITDFGFARKFDNGVLFNTLCGSPMYMAPEIINKQDYSIKSDLWSVGIIIYQMFYGKVPFDVSNFVQLIKKINNEQIHFPSDKIEISSLAINLIKSLLTVDVQKRIEWDMFFYHQWFLTDELLIEENNLMDFSMSNGSSLPNLDKIDNHIGEKHFSSFRHSSIKMRESSIINSSKNLNNSSNKSILNEETNNSLSDNLGKNNNIKHIVENKNDIYVNHRYQNNDKNHTKKNDYLNLNFDIDINDNQTNDLEMNFLESLDYSSSSYTSCDDNNIDNLNLSIDFYDSLENSSKHQYNTRYQARLEKQKSNTASYHTKELNIKSKNKSNSNNTPNNNSYDDNLSVNIKRSFNQTMNNDNTTRFVRSKPIPINVPASITQRKICFDSISDIDRNIKDYVMIDNTKLENQSEPIKHISQKISDSFREYLNSSVTMLKHSYNYITNNKSI